MYIVGAVRNISHNYSTLRGVWCRAASGGSASEVAEENDHHLRMAAAQQLGGAHYDYEVQAVIGSFDHWQPAMEAAHAITRGPDHLIDDEADIGRRDRRNELLIARTDDGARDVPNALHDTARLENEAVSPNLFTLSLEGGQIQVAGAALQ